MISNCITVSEIADIAASISCLLAFVGLMYAGYQFKKNSDTVRKTTFLSSNDKYMDLRKMIIEDESLGEIYSKNISFNDLTKKQRYYIYIIIAFCESLFLTEQVDIFPKYKGGNWRNFIKHTISTPTIFEVWKRETKIEDPDFAKDFIDFVNSMIKK